MMMTQTISRVLVTASESSFLELALKATIALGIALLLLRAGRGWPASLRHLVTAATFGFLVLLPVAAAFAPARIMKVSLPANHATASAELQTAGSGVVSSTRENPTPSHAGTARPAETGLRVFSIVRAAYLFIAISLVTALATALWRVCRLRAQAEVSISGIRLANGLARELGMRTNLEVLVSGKLNVPITFGFARPTILLPLSAIGWSEEELRRVLRHELEHVRRADWTTKTLAQITCAAYWPHPLAWIALRRMSLEAERACDDAVVRSFPSADKYAEQLVSLARQLTGHGSVQALAMATRSNLAQRVGAILDPRLRRGPLTLTRLLVAVAVASLGLMTIAPFRVVNAAAQSATPIHQSEKSPDPLDVALLEAADEGNLRAIQRLLDAGANVNATISGDGSPLIVAAREGSAAAVRLLLDRGAEVNLGVTGDGNALIMAAREGHLDVVQLLLDRGAEIDRVVDGDENALIQASWKGRLEVVRLLISRGANVNARVWAGASRNGVSVGEWRTPLSMALREGHQNVVNLLRSAGAAQ